MLYFTAGDSTLYAFNPDGSLDWKFKFDATVDNRHIITPTISKDNVLYVGYSNKLYAFTTTSNGLADSPWSKAGQNYTNTGRKINPAPYLVAPKDDSTHIQDTITLKWISIPGATEYELEMDKNEDFSGSLIYSAKLSDTLQLIENLQFSNTYYWHVRVSTPEGLSGWSPTWNFTYGNATNVLEMEKNMIG